MDKIDFKILGCLLENCRTSDRQIGSIVGLTSVAVRRRIQKMVENETIEKFVLKVEPPVLGYHMLYVIVSGQKLDDILEQIKLVGEPFVVIPCIGGVTVCGIVVKDEVQKKIKIAKNIMRDIKVLSIYEAEDPEFESNLTRTDLQIVTELSKDPKAKIEDIATELKLSTKTVTRSIDKLQKHTAIQFTVICNPRKMDGNIPYSILITVNGDTTKLMNQFKKEFSDMFLQQPFVAKNQIVLVMYGDDIFKLDDITERIRDYDGVEAAEIFIPKDVQYPIKWIDDALMQAQDSSKLHLVYPTNK